MNVSIRTILATTAATAFLGSLNAGDLKLTPDAKPQADVGTYTLQKRSSFNLRSDHRTPFWPIGWVKREKGSHAEITHAAKPKIDQSAFNVTSILVGNPSLAVVNGRAYSEGELIKMPKGSAPMKVRVEQVADGSVTLQYEDQRMVVAMRRAELPERGALPEQLLDDDR